MISAKKARKLYTNVNRPLMKWINNQVKEAARSGERSVRLRIMPAFGFPGMYEREEIRSKGFAVDYDEYETWIELDWN